MSKSIDKMNKQELRAACKAAGMTGYSKLTVGGMREELKKLTTPKASKPSSAGTRKIEKDRPEQNGITRPSAGTVCREAWDAFDRIGVDVATAQDARNLAEANGWNKNNTSIEFYQWRRFNGVFGRQKKAAK